MRISQQFLIAAFTLTSAVVLIAQQPQSTAWAVPRVVRVSSSFRPVNGLAVLPVENVLLAIYAEEVGGAALWQETQNVTMDGEGRFSVLLGSTRNEGLPLELFAAGQPRWVGIQVQRPGEVEQPRVLLASVPYALKAVDADTLGGQPASAYLLAPSTAPSAGGAGVAAGNTDGSIKPAKLLPKFTSGTTNHIAKFVSNLDLGDSVMVESIGKIGIGTGNPAAALEISTVGGGAQFTNTAANNFTFNTFSSPGNASYLYNFGNAYPTSGRFVQSSTLLDAGSILSLSAASNVRFYTNGSNERMRIDSSGNVGIGTLAPGTKLDLAGDMNLTGRFFKSGNPFLHTAGGDTNLAVGISALSANTTGYGNAAGGYQALFSNKDAYGNTGFGAQALFTNVSGTGNTAVGDSALLSNTASNNTATGYAALYKSTSGEGNTANGANALYNNADGRWNTAMGWNALSASVSDQNNTAIGYLALSSNNGGNEQTAVGARALRLNKNGFYNTAIGDSALENIDTYSSNNIGLGTGAGGGIQHGDNNIMLGNYGIADDKNAIRIGTIGTQATFFAAGVYGATPFGSAVNVVIDGNGQLGTINSSSRFKEDIQDMGGASTDLLRLRPVTYRYKQPYSDGSKPIDYGLIAEEVAEVYPDLVVKNQDGQIQTVQYQKLTPMLLNEVQRQSREIDALKAKLAGMSELEARLAVLEAMLSSKATVTSSLRQP